MKASQIIKKYCNVNTANAVFISAAIAILLSKKKQYCENRFLISFFSEIVDFLDFFFVDNQFSFQNGIKPEIMKTSEYRHITNWIKLNSFVGKSCDKMQPTYISTY